ncbi:MAG: hypothetical protein HY320_02850 [Armatimonadetes bacterium]|nr:hypothetical protein [Armatimonadota bacterium]
MLWLYLFCVLLAAVAACFIVSFTRLRLGPPPGDDRAPGAATAILPEEWERVRCGQCVPIRCPRAIGNPLRPRKDSHCEICAAMFLDRYWKRLLAGRSPSDRGWSSYRGVEVAREAEAGEGAQSVRLELPLAEQAASPPAAHRPRGGSPRWGRVLFVGGLITFLVGVTAAVLLPPGFMLPGYTLCAIGVACLIRGAASGAV